MLKARYILHCIMVLTLPYFVEAQKPVDFKPNRLESDMKKMHHFIAPVYKELKLTNSLEGRYFEITDTSGSANKFYAYIGRVNSCRQGGCSITKTAKIQGTSEYFDYYILFDSDLKVKQVKVFNYQATHGQEITAKGWLKQFIGYAGKDNLIAGKNIDAISGATISVNAITFDIETRSRQLKEVIGLMVRAE
jgi:Na+-translocating ferredoxin:NAD+ oxidoreductase RnfG subunit